MNPRLTAKIARWSAVAALAIALVAAGIFARRQWTASRATRHLPAAVPPKVQQQSLHFTFSKTDGAQTLFTIHAARATKYRGAASVLDDVDIVVHGEHGERNDQIRTHSCDYQADTGSIVCHGTVTLDLSSLPLGPTAKTASPTGKIHVETSAVSFNRDTGDATTNAPVSFRFPEGQGSGIGVEYSSRAANFRLRRDVKMRLAPMRTGNLPTYVTAQGGLIFNRKDDDLHLAGPVQIRQGARTIDTGAMTVHLNQQLRPQRANTSENTIVSVAQGQRRGSLQSQAAEILFDPQGRISRLNATGRVAITEQGPAGIDLRADQASIGFDSADEQPRRVETKGNVRLAVNRPTGVMHLDTGSLDLAIAPAAKGSRELRLASATAPGESNAEWISKSSGNVRLKSDRLRATFDANNQIQMLHGTGGVELQRHQPNQEPLVTRAEELVANFSHGRWTSARESGGVRAEQGTRSGRADRASWLPAQSELNLTGSAQVNDPSGQIFADAIAWNQKTEQLRATGDVRTSYTPAAGGKNAVATAPASPVNIVSSALNADLENGHAVYSGSARLWNGNQVLQADRIELNRARGELIATGNVLAAFPQAPRRMIPSRISGQGKAAKSATRRKMVSDSKKPEMPVMWRVRAGRLRYVQSGAHAGIANHMAAGVSTSAKAVKGEVTLGGGVEAWSSQGRIQAKTMVLQLQPGANGRTELDSATAGGGVRIRQGERWGVARSGSYSASTGQFELWGGKPSLHDSSGDLVTGDRLTFSVADDTILVESSEGSRTLTRHPVPNR